MHGDKKKKKKKGKKKSPRENPSNPRGKQNPDQARLQKDDQERKGVNRKIEESKEKENRAQENPCTQPGHPEATTIHNPIPPPKKKTYISFPSILSQPARPFPTSHRPLLLKTLQSKKKKKKKKKGGVT